MKMKWCDRLALMISALLVLVVSVGMIVYCFSPSLFAIDPEDAFFTAPRVFVLAAGILTFLCAAYLITLPHKLRGGKGAFVVQQTDNGELRISVKAIESLVQKCIDMHEEIHVVSMDIKNGREGVTVDLRISLANNISIPLAVVSLQKQIKQYLIVSSGIDVREVRVSVETTAEGGVGESPYRVGVEEQQAERAEILSEKAQPAPKEKKKAPLHQRIFGREETPEIVPEKPLTAEAHDEKLTAEIFADDEAEQAPEQPGETPAKAPDSTDENAETAAPETDTPEQPA